MSCLTFSSQKWSRLNRMVWQITGRNPPAWGTCYSCQPSSLTCFFFLSQILNDLFIVYAPWEIMLKWSFTFMTLSAQYYFHSNLIRVSEIAVDFTLVPDFGGYVGSIWFLQGVLPSMLFACLSWQSWSFNFPRHATQRAVEPFTTDLHFDLNHTKYMCMYFDIYSIKMNYVCDKSKCLNINIHSQRCPQKTSFFLK